MLNELAQFNLLTGRLLLKAFKLKFQVIADIYKARTWCMCLAAEGKWVTPECVSFSWPCQWRFIEQTALSTGPLQT